MKEVEARYVIFGSGKRGRGLRVTMARYGLDGRMRRKRDYDNPTAASRLRLEAVLDAAPAARLAVSLRGPDAPAAILRAPKVRRQRMLAGSTEAISC
jgi:hypothetical protein